MRYSHKFTFLHFFTHSFIPYLSNFPVKHKMRILKDVQSCSSFFFMFPQLIAVNSDHLCQAPKKSTVFLARHLSSLLKSRVGFVWCEQTWTVCHYWIKIYSCQTYSFKYGANNNFILGCLFCHFCCLWMNYFGTWETWSPTVVIYKSTDLDLHEDEHDWISLSPQRHWLTANEASVCWNYPIHWPRPNFTNGKVA